MIDTAPTALAEEVEPEGLLPGWRTVLLLLLGLAAVVEASARASPRGSGARISSARPPAPPRAALRCFTLATWAAPTMTQRRP